MTSESTSKIRSTTTVAASSARDAPELRWSATTRAASPARAGSTLLKKYPTRSALVVLLSGGRRSGANSDRQRTARRTTATASAAIAGRIHHQLLERNAIHASFQRPARTARWTVPEVTARPSHGT